MPTAFLPLLIALPLILGPTYAWGVITLKINGSTTVNPVVVEAAEAFRKKGWKVLVDTQGGSSGGISYLAEGLADIGMSSRSVSEHDRAKFPKTTFKQHIIGYDGVALVVSKKLYDEGVRALSKTQIKSIYEGAIKNWQQVGGPDRKITFFNKEPGRGTWEVFAKYIYGDSKRAPKVFHPEVGGNQEARTKVGQHDGAVTQLSAAWAWDTPKVRALAIKNDDGKIIAPTIANIKNSTYPLKRPLLLVTSQKPEPTVKEFISYLSTDQGKKHLTKYGYLPLEE